MLLSTTDRANFVTIGKDRLSVSYHGQGSHAHDVGAVRSEAPFPSAAGHRGSTVHYFEVEILETGTRNCIAVGLATSDFSLMRFPGCERHSYGYHGDDGRLYVDGGRGDAYGPRFRRGDVIGCGVQLDRSALFFTRNGALLSVLPLALAPSLYAVVALHSPGESVRVNFGATPFRFDVAEMIASLEQNRTERVCSMQISDFGVRQMIRHHLLFHAHASTVRAFDDILPTSVVTVSDNHATPGAAVSTAAVASASSMQADDPPSLDARVLYIPTFAELSESLALRVQLRAAVVAGEIEQTALPLLRKHWPELLERASFQGVLQQVRYQAFIERLRGGDLVAAVAYARAELTAYRGVDHATTLRAQYGKNESSHTFIVALPTVLGLLAYNDVRESPLQVQFGGARRQWLARCLNERVVAHQCNAATTASALEVAKRQEASIEHEHLADAICTVCGVVATRLIFEESEWRDFAEDEVSKSRVGAATSIYGDSNLDTQIAGYNRGGDRFAPRGSIARSHAQLSGDDAQEHQYVSKMSNIADILQLPAETKDMAHAIYKDVRGELKNAQGQKQRLKRDGLCAALLFIAGKKTGSQRTFKAIAAMTSIPEKDIRNAYKSITRYKPQLAAESSTSTVESLVSTFAAQLDVPQRLTQLCITVANNARSHAEGKLPQTVAAAAMYLVLSFHPQVKADLHKIADVAGLADGTVNALFRELYPIKTQLFPPDHKFH